MRLVMTVLARDEEDIIGWNLRYHLSRGVDHIIVTDNRSQDGTRDIVREIGRSGRVTYLFEPQDDFSQDPDDGLYTDLEIDVNALDWSGYNTERSGSGDDLREYVVEYVGPVTALRGSLSVGAGAASDKRFLYRISGRGESVRGSTRVIQTIYATAE